MRTPPERPADGVVGWIYESFVPGEWHRWLEKEIPWFCFLWAEPERMISGWTAFSRDSSKTCLLYTSHLVSFKSLSGWYFFDANPNSQCPDG